MLYENQNESREYVQGTNELRNNIDGFGVPWFWGLDLIKTRNLLKWSFITPLTFPGLH